MPFWGHFRSSLSGHRLRTSVGIVGLTTLANKQEQPKQTGQNQQTTVDLSFPLLPFFVVTQQKTKPATMADMMFYLKKNKEKEAIKKKEREEKAKLKDVLITDTAETSIR